MGFLGRNCAHLQTELARVARPAGLGWAVGVLSYLTTVGVVVPIIALASQPVPSSMAGRRVIVALFLTGLITLLIYLIHAIQQLRKESETKPPLATQSKSTHSEIKDTLAYPA